MFNIKNKKLVTIIILSLVLIIGIIVLIMTLKMPSKKAIPKEINYKHIEEKISNKESFNLLIINSAKSDSKKLLNYYKDTYGLKYDYLIANYKNENYNNLIKKMNIKVINNRTELFVAIKDGIVVSSFGGIISEQNLRSYLITNKFIDKKYKKIDYVFKDDEFKKYYNESKTYILLYINKDNNNLNAYRKILVKNEVNSLIMFSKDFEQIKTSQYFNKKFDLGDDETKKLPILIKMKDGDVISKKYNISVEAFSDFIKK